MVLPHACLVLPHADLHLQCSRFAEKTTLSFRSFPTPVPPLPTSGYLSPLPLSTASLASPGCLLCVSSELPVILGYLASCDMRVRLLFSSFPVALLGAFGTRSIVNKKGADHHEPTTHYNPMCSNFDILWTISHAFPALYHLTRAV